MLGTRITHRSMMDSSMEYLQESLQRSQKLSEQMSTGRRFNKPSEDPTGTMDALNLRAEKAATEQHASNAEDGIGWLNQADTALQSVISIIRNARDKAMYGANDPTGAQGRKNIAKELETLKPALQALANTQYLGRPVFGGTNGATDVYDASYNYVGGTGNIQRRISESATVNVNTHASSAFGTGANSIFAILDETVTALENDDTNAIKATLDKFGAAEKLATTALVGVGTRASQLDSVKARTADATLSLQTRIATVESIDLPKTIMEMQMQEIAHKAALGATAKVLQPTLMDFLR